MLKHLLPLGTRDEFGRRARTKQHLIAVIQAHFKQRGLAPIATPLLENEAVFDPYQMGNYQLIWQRWPHLGLTAGHDLTSCSLH